MIVGLGCLAHDHVAVTDTAWAAGKGHIIHREDRFGGNAPNALATIAALGYPAAYLATVGTSETGDAGVADLAASLAFYRDRLGLDVKLETPGSPRRCASTAASTW